MKRVAKTLLLSSFVFGLSWSPFSNGSQGKVPEMLAIKPADWRWEPIPKMKPGAERVVLRQGASTGAIELLARYPSGYVVPWHWHSANERLVVMEDRFRIESGNHSVELEPGGFVYQPGRNLHQVTCVSNKRCVYYALWDGPWDINFVQRR